MLLKAIRWSPPVMYETLPKKRWDILHINWWSLDFWTINSMNIAILMDPWIMGVKFRPPHMKKWTHHVFDHMGVSENSGTSKSFLFNRVFRYKPSILGVPPFSETPISSCKSPSFSSCDSLNQLVLVDTFDITDCLSFVLGSFNPTINYKTNAEAKRGTTRIPTGCGLFFGVTTPTGKLSTWAHPHHP